MMRFSPKIEQYRLTMPGTDCASFHGDKWGAFLIPGPCGMPLLVIATSGDGEVERGWEHVSVSIKVRRPPNWTEMCFIKDLFWPSEDCVVQFHPPEADYVNNLNNCLHLWRHRTLAFPRPPQELVGIKALGVLR